MLNRLVATFAVTLCFDAGAVAANCDEVGNTGTEYERAVAKVQCVNDRAKLLTFVIQEFGIYDIDSAGGVRPYIVFTNPNEAAAIKYLSVEAMMYNQVGDPIKSQIGGGLKQWIRIVGPVAFDDGVVRINWERPVWYNSTVDCLRITGVKVEYMNGKAEATSGPHVSKMVAEPARNDCKVR